MYRFTNTIINRRMTIFKYGYIRRSYHFFKHCEYGQSPDGYDYQFVKAFSEPISLETAYFRVKDVPLYEF